MRRDRRPKFNRPVLAVVAATLAAASCAHAPTGPREAAGLSLAERSCGECHAVSGSGPSPLADAPPFTRLPARFDVDHFSRAYRNGMFEGHPRMPRVDLDPDQLAQLSAYLRSLRR